MKCKRIGGCLKERTKDWATPQQCSCELLERLEYYYQLRTGLIGRNKHLSDIEFINQNARGK